MNNYTYQDSKSLKIVPERTLFQHPNQPFKSEKLMPTASKSLQTYNTVLSVLALLATQNPIISKQISVLRSAIQKWNQHNSDESVKRSQQLMEVKRATQCSVRQQIGIVIEEIGQYLSRVVSQFRDPNMQHYLSQFLKATKKLKWQPPSASRPDRSILISKETQTTEDYDLSSQIQNPFCQPDCFPLETNTSLHVSPERQRPCRASKCQQLRDQMSFQLQELEASYQAVDNLRVQNQDLKNQTAALQSELTEAQQASDYYLKEIGKLNRMLNKIKTSYEIEQQSGIEIKQAQLFSPLSRMDMDLQTTIKQKLQEAEVEIVRKQSNIQSQQLESGFNSNYLNSSPQGLTLGPNQELRLLLIQALVIEQYVKTQQNKEIIF